MTMTLLDNSTRQAAQAAPGVQRVVAPDRFLRVANLAAWVVFLGITLTVAPTVDPAAPIGAVSVFLSTILMIALIGAAFGLATGASWGYLATAGGGALMIGATAMCFAGGHTGAWVFAQGLSGAGLALTGATSWKISR